MIAVKMVSSDDPLYVNHQYLARIDKTYFVVNIFDPTPKNRTFVPYKEAVFCIGNDTTSSEPVTKLHEIAEIT